MLKSKVCCVLALALIDSLWVQALPSIRTLDKNSIYNTGRFGPLRCPENEFLNDEGKACEPTCENPVSPDVCKEKKIIACECDDGYVRNATGACIRPEKCLHQLPPKSENTLSVSGSNKPSGVLIEIYEPRTIEIHDNETVIEATTEESEAYDLEDLEKIDAIRSELEIDPGLLEYLSNAHNEYHRKHILEHQPDQSKKGEEREAEINALLKEIFDVHGFDNIDYSESNDINGFVDLENWEPMIFK